MTEAHEARLLTSLVPSLTDEAKRLNRRPAARDRGELIAVPVHI